MFKDTNSHRFVSLLFMCILGKFFGVEISTLKSTISELYMNLSYETLNGARGINLQAISNLILDITSGTKHATVPNINRKEQEDTETTENISDSFGFVGESEDQKFKKEHEDHLKTDLEHKKREHLYLESTVQDAATIEVETKKEEKDFNDLKIQFGQIDDAATQQKQNKMKQYVELLYDVLDIGNLFNDTVEDIFIDDDLFHNTDNKDIKIIVHDILRYTKTEQKKVYRKNHHL